MSQGVWILIFILVAGMAAGNKLVITAAAVLIALVVLGLEKLVPVVEQHSINIGLTMLIVGLLTPFADNRLGLNDVTVGLKGSVGIASLIGGALAAYMCAQGLELLAQEPEVIVGLVAGTILGVALLRGVPVGPLAAAGLAAVLLKIMRIAK